jgi:hypothetical protein
MPRYTDVLSSNNIFYKQTRLIKNEQGLNTVFIAKPNRSAAETCNLLRNSSGETTHLHKTPSKNDFRILGA